MGRSLRHAAMNCGSVGHVAVPDQIPSGRSGDDEQGNDGCGGLGHRWPASDRLLRASGHGRDRTCRWTCGLGSGACSGPDWCRRCGGERGQVGAHDRPVRGIVHQPGLVHDGRLPRRGAGKQVAAAGRAVGRPEVDGAAGAGPRPALSWSVVSCRGARDCVAVGYRDTYASHGFAVLAERWNGARWLVIQSRNPGHAASAFLNGVSCTRRAGCLAVGSTTTRSGDTHALAEKWTRGHWRTLSVTSPALGHATDLNGVSCAGVTCMAVGQYTRTGGRVLALSARWNGRAWRVLRQPARPARPTACCRTCPAGPRRRAGRSATPAELTAPADRDLAGPELAADRWPQPGRRAARRALMSGQDRLRSGGQHRQQAAEPVLDRLDLAGDERHAPATPGALP